jgi:hypothetical protein
MFVQPIRNTRNDTTTHDNGVKLTSKINTELMNGIGVSTYQQQSHSLIQY